MSSPPKRPRLSLMTRASPAPETLVKTSTAAMAAVDTSSPTAFNTLSNAYAAAIEQSSPMTALPPKSAIFDPVKSANPTRKTSLRLVTNAGSQDSLKFPSQHTHTPGPFTIVYPDTPTPFSELTPITAHPESNAMTTTPFTFTPPQSAHALDDVKAQAFPFSKTDTCRSPRSPRTPRRRFTTSHSWHAAPYTHPRALHSILRNSPLPPRSSITPISPSRVSKRIAERAAKKLCFNNPLTQEITTQTYTRSHIDLLAEEASPFTPTDPEAAAFCADPATLAPLETLDLAMAYTGDETRDGGQTPGPFEEMRRRMAGLGASSENESESTAQTPKTKKRKRREKKRQWIWTIGTNELEDEDEEMQESTARPITFAKTPITAIRRGNTPGNGETDTDITDGESCADTTDAESVADTDMGDMGDYDRSHSI